MVARGAGAAGPVLLPCRQWDPLGLARRMPGSGLVRAVVSNYCLGGCGALFVCARRSLPVRGGLWPVPCFVSSPFPPSPPAFPALRVAVRPVRVSLILARLYAIPCGLCVPRARSGCPSDIPLVSFACVCARALAASAPLLPPGVVVARTPRMVPVLGAKQGLATGSVPLCVSCLGPVHYLACFRGVGPVPFPPCPA